MNCRRCSRSNDEAAEADADDDGADPAPALLFDGERCSCGGGADEMRRHGDGEDRR